MVREVDRAKRETAGVAYGGVNRERVNSACCDMSKRAWMTWPGSGEIAVVVVFGNPHRRWSEVEHAAKSRMDVGALNIESPGAE